MTAPAHEHYLELASVYALGALDGEERFRFEEHLASGCEDCRSALMEAEAAASDLALAAPAMSPPDSVRERLFSRVAKDLEPSVDEPASARRPGRLFILLAAAATLAAVALGVRTRVLEDLVAEERLTRERVESELRSLEAMLEAFTAPDTLTVSLEGQGSTPDAKAKAFLDPQRGRLFLYVYGLPAPPPGHTYQLWLIADDTPVSIGVFTVDPGGGGRLDADRVPSFRGAVTVAVTVEPAPGVPQPTGPMVLLGS